MHRLVPFVVSALAKTAAVVAIGAVAGSAAFGCAPADDGSDGATTREGAIVQATDGDPRAAHCARDRDFPSTLDVPEASGAAIVELGGREALLVVSDHNNDGAAILVALDGTDARSIRLPLDPSVSDDIEGVSWHDGAVFTLTSSGAVTRFVPSGNGFRRSGSAYAIGRGSDSCSDLGSSNCGRDYEGLCLRKHLGSARCLGYAASKKHAALYCVQLDGDKLVMDDTAAPIEFDFPSNSLSDCAFGDRTLAITTNDHNGSKSYTVDEATGALHRIDATGLTANEAIAIASDGSLYQLDDSSVRPSKSSHWTGCGL